MRRRACTLPWQLPLVRVRMIADDPLVGSIAQQYLTDREAHDTTAAEWTKRYAQG